MGYKIKWLENNLGVSRKAIINYEEKGLLPPNDGKDREFSEEQVQQIWTIRLLQGMGFSLKEIGDMSRKDGFDFEKELNKKVDELEEVKKNITAVIDYARSTKFTGRILNIRPEMMGKIRFNDFYKRMLEESDLTSEFSEATAKCFRNIDKPQEEILSEMSEAEILQMTLDMYSAVKDGDMPVFNLHIPRQIVKRIDLGADNSEVQLLVKMIYEDFTEKHPGASLKQFVRYVGCQYVMGDIRNVNVQYFGEEGCAFLADAIAVFGGYSDYKSFLEEDGADGQPKQ